MTANRPRKVVIPGGSGQLGDLLARAFQAAGDEVVVLSRQPRQCPWRVVRWDSRRMGAWADKIDGADVVINLAGRSVNCRYNVANRRDILESRVESTRIVGQAIVRARRPPTLWLQGGTATIYAHRYDSPNEEVTGRIGGHEPDVPESWRFSVHVATAWERSFVDSHVPRTRKVMLRSAMVMSPDRGGVFDVLLRLIRFGLGGRAGDGCQYVSWIHDQDFFNAISWLIDHREIEGPINIVSPHPVPNEDFMRELREAQRIRFGLPSTKWMLEVGAFLLRTETELVLKSRRVVPQLLSDGGFLFQFPSWPAAAKDLCRRWQSARSTG